MKKILSGLGLAAIAIFCVVSPIAAAYTANVVVDNIYGGYAMLPVIWSVDNPTLVTGGYITTAGTDVGIKVSGASIPRMLTDTTTLFATPIGASQVTTAIFSTGNAPSDFAIIDGPNGYITTADAEALEPGTSFIAELNGWIDTTYWGQRGYLINKPGAVQLYLSAANTITATVGSYAIDQYQATQDGVIASIYGSNWVSQTFTAGSTNHGYQMSVKLSKTLSPTGSVYLGLRATAAGVPTGADIATSNLVNCADLTGSMVSYDFFFSGTPTLTNGAVYAFVVETTLGLDAANYVNVGMQTVGAYAGGAPRRTSDGGATWAAPLANDLYFIEYSQPQTSITVAGQASGVHDYSVALSGGTLTLYDGVTSLGTAAFAGTVTNDTANWFLMDGNTVPYASYIKLTVGGVLVVTYQPHAIISSNTLPDLTGVAQNGTFTFVANLAGITVTSAYGLVSTSTGGIPTVAPTNRPDFLLPAAPPSDNPLATGTPFDPAISAIVNIGNTNSGNATLISIPMVWAILWFIIIEGAMVLCLKYIPKQWIGAVVGGIGFVAAWHFGALPWWTSILFIITAVGIIVDDMDKAGG